MKQKLKKCKEKKLARIRTLDFSKFWHQNGSFQDSVQRRETKKKQISKTKLKQERKMRMNSRDSSQTDIGKSLLKMKAKVSRSKSPFSSHKKPSGDDVMSRRESILLYLKKLAVFYSCSNILYQYCGADQTDLTLCRVKRVGWILWLLWRVRDGTMLI